MAHIRASAKRTQIFNNIQEDLLWERGAEVEQEGSDDLRGRTTLEHGRPAHEGLAVGHPRGHPLELRVLHDRKVKGGMCLQLVLLSDYAW